MDSDSELRRCFFQGLKCAVPETSAAQDNSVFFFQVQMLSEHVATLGPARLGFSVWVLGFRGF